jgi:hypothetical protein
VDAALAANQIAAGGAASPIGNKVINPGDGIAIGGDQNNNADAAAADDGVAAPAGNKVINAGDGTSIGGNQNNYAAPDKHCLLGGRG